MTDKQKLFCDEYLIDMNATRAYKAVYKDCKKDETVTASASRLLRNVNVKAYIDKRIEDRTKRTEITQDMVIKELAKIAFFNIKNIFTEQGTLKDVKDLDDDTAGAISAIEVTQKAGAMKLEFGGGIPIEHIPEETTKIKTNDKKGALELLGKHLGMFKETNMNINMSYEDYINKVADEDDY